MQKRSANRRRWGSRLASRFLIDHRNPPFSRPRFLLSQTPLSPPVFHAATLPLSFLFLFFSVSRALDSHQFRKILIVSSSYLRVCTLVRAIWICFRGTKINRPRKAWLRYLSLDHDLIFFHESWKRVTRLPTLSRVRKLATKIWLCLWASDLVEIWNQSERIEVNVFCVCINDILM